MAIKLHVWQRNFGLMGKLCSSSLPSQTGWQQEGGRGGPAETAPQPFKSFWGWAIPQPVPALRKTRICQKTLLPASFPCLRGHLALIPASLQRKHRSQERKQEGSNLQITC